MLFSLWLVCSAKLIKVAVLARHGNRAPNAPVPFICPNSKDVIANFSEPVGAKQKAALSKVGMAENMESGVYLKQKYIGPGKLLEDDTYYDDGSTFFFSERMNRNIMSVVALTRGMFPDGNGQKGFESSNPNFVPILTSQPFEDTLMNLPRDGPCKSRYNMDRKLWNAYHEQNIVEQNSDLLEELSNYCGFDYSNIKELTGKSLVWALKATSDLFTFAENEGIELEPTFPAPFRSKIQALAKTLVNQQRFQQPHQITYWIGRFLDDAIFANLRYPDEPKEKLVVEGNSASSEAPWETTPQEFYHQNKFLLFLNHRELLISVLTMFQLDDVLKNTPPAGSMLLWEVHEDDRNDRYLRMYFWRPSQPAWEAKNSKHKSGDPVWDLYNNGTEEEVFPKVCKTNGRCTLSELESAYAQWIAATGSWSDVCGLNADMSVNDFFRETELVANDGDDDDGWREQFEKPLFGVANKFSSAVLSFAGCLALAIFVTAGVFLVTYRHYQTRDYENLSPDYFSLG